MSKPKALLDMHRFKEDDRIRAIGNYCMDTGDKAGIIVENEPGKRERYIKKLTEWFPMVEVADLHDGPTEGTVMFTARRKSN